MLARISGTLRLHLLYPVVLPVWLILQNGPCLLPIYWFLWCGPEILSLALFGPLPALNLQTIGLLNESPQMIEGKRKGYNWHKYGGEVRTIPSRILRSRL